MNPQEMKEIRDYLRPSFRTIGVSAGFCALLFVFIAACGNTAHSVQDGILCAGVSAAVLCVPVLTEWSAFFAFLQELRAGLSTPERRQALAEDYRDSRYAFGGEVRIGQAYFYGHQSGVLLPRQGQTAFAAEKKIYFRGGWNWQISAEDAHGGRTKLVELRPKDWSEADIARFLADANDKLNPTP